MLKKRHLKILQKICISHKCCSFHSLKNIGGINRIKQFTDYENKYFLNQNNFRLIMWSWRLE